MAEEADDHVLARYPLVDLTGPNLYTLARYNAFHMSVEPVVHVHGKLLIVLWTYILHEEELGVVKNIRRQLLLTTDDMDICA